VWHRIWSPGRRNPGISKLTAPVSAQQLTVALRRGEAGGSKPSCVTGMPRCTPPSTTRSPKPGVADLYRQAQQDALARAARQRPPTAQAQSARHVLGLPVIAARRALTA
jgi:hypothetical protein